MQAKKNPGGRGGANVCFLNTDCKSGTKIFSQLNTIKYFPDKKYRYINIIFHSK